MIHTTILIKKQNSLPSVSLFNLDTEDKISILQDGILLTNKQYKKIRKHIQKIQKVLSQD